MIEKKIIETLKESCEPSNGYKEINGKIHITVAHIDLDKFVKKMKTILSEEHHIQNN